MSCTGNDAISVKDAQGIRHPRFISSWMHDKHLFELKFVIGFMKIDLIVII